MDRLRITDTQWAKMAPHRLGKPRYKQTEGCVTFFYRFDSEDTPPIQLRLKVEINTREHFVVCGFTRRPSTVSSRWFEGACDIPTYHLDELLGTKLRALYRPKKGRGLFDLGLVLKDGAADPDRIVWASSAYIDHGGHEITRVVRGKHQGQTARPSVHSGYRATARRRILLGHDAAAACVSSALIARLPGAPWKSGE